jgi:predicted nucleotidyltransferase
MVSPAIDRLVEEIGAHPQVSRVWLFGSRARGVHRPRSDVDLAIEAPHADRRTWIALCDLADEAETLLRIDLIRLDEAPPELADRIRREGMVLYER